MPMKPLSFKGDKKPSKKRRHQHSSTNDDDDNDLHRSKPTTTNNNTEDQDETWLSPSLATDITGPIILVLPTVPVTALSSDPLGNIYAGVVENIVDDVPETAEPHDVRQVWVANSIPGTGKVTLKASHGGYLSCDSLGVLGARREARGFEEGFEVERVPVEDEDGDGKRRRRGLRWRFRTAASPGDGVAGDAVTNASKGEKGQGYLCAVVDRKIDTTAPGMKRDHRDEDDEDDTLTKSKKVSISLRGDGTAGSETIEIIVKMQARFLPKTAAQKEAVARDKVSRSELERAVGRKLNDDEVRRLKRARKDGMYHEEILDVRVKGKHDKFAS